jgi:hypothetical protein
VKPKRKYVRKTSPKPPEQPPQRFREHATVRGRE